MNVCSDDTGSVNEENLMTRNPRRDAWLEKKKGAKKTYKRTGGW